MLKPEDIVTALDLKPEEFADVNEFVEKFGTEWVRKAEAAKDPDIHKSVMGAANNIIRGKAKKAFGVLGFDDVKVDELDPGDLFGLVAERIPPKLTALEEAAKKGSKGGEEVEKLKTQLAEATKTIQDTKALHQSAVQAYNDLDLSVKTSAKENRISAEWDRAIGAQKFRQGLSEFEKEGFLSRMRKEFKVEFDEAGAPYAADASTGHRIPEPGKAQKFLDLPSLVAMKVKEFKLDEVNPHGNKPVGGQRPTHTPIVPPQRRPTEPQLPERSERLVHPRLGI